MTFCLFLCLGNAETFAQAGDTRPKSSIRALAKESKTTVAVELLVGREGVGRYAQEWRRVFEELQVSLRVRQGLSTDKLTIKERTFGRLRKITVIGKLERSGRLVFSDRVVTTSKTAELAEWLRELQTYGAQGAPDGKPLWGLNESQFTEIDESLRPPLQAEPQGLPLTTAINKFSLSEKFPLRFSTAAESWLADRDRQHVARNNLSGFSSGTALAILLSEYGLGFRPLRTPEGSIELVVQRLSDAEKHWPVGWELTQKRWKTAPKLFRLVPVELEDVALSDVLNTVSAQTEIPICIDHYRLRAKGIDITKLHVSHPKRKSSWSLLLKRVTNPSKMTRRLLIDEQGRPFIWITTLEPGRQQR